MSSQVAGAASLSPLRRAEEAGKLTKPGARDGDPPGSRPGSDLTRGQTLPMPPAPSASPIAIRVPSTAALFDAWSAEPLATRPLSDEARERIVDAWAEVAKKADGTPHLELLLPATERPDADEAAIVDAIRTDLRTMKVDARHHWVRRALAPRESRIGLLIFFAALVAAAVVDYDVSEGSLWTLLGQTFVVLAWVALWGPAYRLLTAASFRLARRYFAELSEAEITIRWD
jgi:hypothetical protein